MENASKKHHYLPAFYLKRWADDNSLLVQFSQPYGKTVPHRTHPNGTGYITGLYSIKGAPNEHDAQTFEEDFLKPLDSLASDALDKFEKQNFPGDLTVKQRSAWTRFIMSLLFRMPEDLTALCDYWAKIMANSTTQELNVYETQRMASDPPTLAEFLSETPEERKEAGLFRLLRKVIDGKRIGEIINNFHWSVLDLSEESAEFFTSDRPILRTSGLDAENSQLVLPIGPRKLFVAARSAEVLEGISRILPADIVNQVNERVVGAAKKFVYACTDDNIDYVRDRMGTLTDERIIESAFSKQA